MDLLMLTRYIQAAMRKATYEILDDGTYYGEIPGVQGPWANADTLVGCQEELQSVLEDWLLLMLRDGLKVPTIDGVRLGAAAKKRSA